ncbi:MAG: preprotein translocase subunit SecE [bacterium]|nr:preprotein translocase subunit SecE [bacterium]MDZ4231879.1 preprotein translocase subunit SecE [Candidatus Pacearchaeota archaeon]
MVNILVFLKEVRLEAKRVNWPLMPEVVRNTVTVLAITLFAAAFLGLVDFVFTRVLNVFIF